MKRVSANAIVNPQPAGKNQRIMSPEQEQPTRKPATQPAARSPISPDELKAQREQALHEAEELRAKIEKLEAERVVIDAQASEQRSRVRRLRLELMLRNMVARTRRVSDRFSIWRPGVFGVCVAVSGAVAAMIYPSIISLIVGLAVGAVVFSLLLLFPKDEIVRERRRDRQAEYDQAVAYSSAVSEHAALQHKVLTETRAQHEQAIDGLRRKQLSESNPQRREQLARRNWKAMRGVQFEQFLVVVFEELGYSVEEVAGRKDDVGDMVLTRSDRRIFVHAKGYFHNVPDAAVEAAHAGMARHRCHRCAVITNSTFTHSARELAATIGCVLVDAGSVDDLIHGQVAL